MLYLFKNLLISLFDLKFFLEFDKNLKKEKKNPNQIKLKKRKHLKIKWKIKEFISFKKEQIKFTSKSNPNQIEI